MVIESDKEILSYILYDIDSSINKKFIEFLRYSIIHHDNNDIYTQEEALEYIANFVEYKNTDNVKFILTNDFLPNVGKNFTDKAYFLGYLINQLLKVQLKKSTNLQIKIIIYSKE